MQLHTRRLLDRVFTGVGIAAVCAMCGMLLVILVPIFKQGLGAVVFCATIEHRKQEEALFGRGDSKKLAEENALAEAARRPIYEMLAEFKLQQREKIASITEKLQQISVRYLPDNRRLQRLLARLGGDVPPQALLKAMEEIVFLLKQQGVAIEETAQISDLTAELQSTFAAYDDLTESLRVLLGPLPGDPAPVLPRRQFGQTRWDNARRKLQRLLFVEKWVYDQPGKAGKLVFIPRTTLLAGTSLEKIPAYVEKNFAAILQPRWTFYGRFFTDKAIDANFFGGIGPALLGTVYLIIGAMLFAAPLGIIAAIYFAEYAKPGVVVSLLRSCIGTLAGVPSIVFGLFGLAFFINTLHVSHSKSVLAGALTLGLLILPTIIRAAEEAILAVPHTYKEAAISLGAGRWRTIMTVILPAALPGILTGIVVSMGRAAGETAPIIFTAAVSIGSFLMPWEIFNNPTPALSWNIYNLVTEHEAADAIRHIQFGMTMTLVALVLLLNLAAILLRARLVARLRH